jgi:hypothetical protein
MTDSTSTSTDAQQRKEPRPLSRAELRRYGLPSDWNDRLRSGDGLAEHRGSIYGPVTRHLHDRMPVILDQFGFAGWLDHGNVERPDDFDTAVHPVPRLAAGEQPEVRRGRLHRAAR